MHYTNFLKIRVMSEHDLSHLRPERSDEHIVCSKLFFYISFMMRRNGVWP